MFWERSVRISIGLDFLESNYSIGMINYEVQAFTLDWGFKFNRLKYSLNRGSEIDMGQRRAS